MRLDKAVADLFIMTRSQAREAIRAGIVMVNDCICTDIRTSIAAGDIIKSGGRSAETGFIYLMMNKPAGVLSVSRDDQQATVIDLLPEQYRKKGLMTVGRLDKDTTGFLIITDDGQFSHRITSPKSCVYKRYAVEYSGQLPANAAALFAAGIALEDGSKCLPARLIPVADGRADVIICEGKYHQVKRMFTSVGCCVTGLSRISIGRAILDSALPPGGVRLLDPAELELLLDEI